MNIAAWLQRTARIHPQRPAIAVGDVVWASYAGFAERAARCAGWLQARGLVAGDRVALFMPNQPVYLPLLWGIWWLGGIAVPINAKLHARETAWIAGHCGCRLILVDAPRHRALADALREEAVATEVVSDFSFVDDASIACAEIAERAEDDPAWLFYTSGTTGRPKGVSLGARQLRWCALGYLASVQAVQPGAVMLHPAPLSHGGGLYHLPYVMNGGLNVIPVSGAFDAAECLDLAAHWRNASLFAAPTMVRRLVDVAKTRGQRPEGLATICYGGGPMYLADIEEALEVVGPHFAQIYGQGECPMTITVLTQAVIADRTQPRHRERLGSVGVAQSMVEVSIRGSDGQPCPVGDSGEVCVRGEVVMLGYWQDPAATDAAIRDGWLWTGDIGRLDDDGFLTLLDRSKDLVVSGGSNIYPREVEEALLNHPRVAEVSVIGRPDPQWGEIVIAYVVTHGSLDAAELDAFCTARIARFKRPRHYRFVDELPKNNYGKLLKTVLRQIESERFPTID